MNNRIKTEKMEKKNPAILVAVDFSSYSAVALRKARDMLTGKPGRILALHVVDKEFVESCVMNALGEEKDIKKQLFTRAKKKLHNFLKKEGLDDAGVETLISEGIPYLEINRQAVLKDAEMIVMGSRGNSEEMNSIFFGSTTERVLRFIKRPVLCVPPEENNKEF